MVALIAGAPLTITAVGGLIAVLRGQRGIGKKIDRAELKLDKNTEITSETRQLADGRLTDMTKKMEEVTGKLATSEANVARLIHDGIAAAASDVLAKAQVTAKDLLDQAKGDAAALLARAERDAPRRRR